MPRPPKDKPPTDTNEPQSVSKPAASPPIPPPNRDEQLQNPDKPMAKPPIPPQIIKIVEAERSSDQPPLVQKPVTETTSLPPPKRPERPIKRSEMPRIDKALAGSGEVFIIGDRVQIAEPYGNPGAAAIEAFYADVAGEIWAQIKPIEDNPDCRWEQGCIRAERLVKPPSAP